MRPHTNTALAVSAMLLTISAAVIRPASGQTARPLDAEARALALRVWEKEFLKCGASYYSYRGNEYVDAHGRIIRVDEHGPKEVPPNEYLGIVEYKTVSFSSVAVKPDQLSSADRLNGVQWKGEVMSPSFSVFRFRDRTYGEWHPWQDWQNTKPDFHGAPLEKKNGQWLLDLADGPVPVESWLSERNLPSCTSFTDPKS